ncbi:hypothetical protein KEM52_002941, partial [Ascosphaera acerosa]
MFGGEFSSPKQGTFYHYNDFWHLDPVSREWSRIETKGKGPPARSGHRMTYYKNYIILFGGFQDTSQQTKYLQDLWIYDCQRFAWYNPLPPQKPDARSSFSFLPHESGAVLYGGYSRAKASAPANTGGRSQKGGGGGGASKTVLKPVVHEDTWFLRITPPAADAPASTPPAVRWERRKKPANTPSPARAGVSMAYHKGRGMLFGGVHDVEASEEGIESEFFNELYAWNTDRNRFFPVGLRRPKTGGGKRSGAQQQGGGQAQRTRNRAKADEEELLANLARLEAKARGEDTAGVEGYMEKLRLANQEAPGGADGESDGAAEEATNAAAKRNLPVRFEMPHPRFNAQLAVLDDTLYIYGGTYEKGDQEFNFNDLYAIDLGKLDGCKEIYYREPDHWNDMVDDDDDDDDDDEEEEEDDEEDDGEDDGEAAQQQAATAKAAPPPPPPADDEVEETEAAPRDHLPHPRPFESLREFFARSATEWQEVVIKRAQERSAGAGAAVQADKTVKELRKDAFELAEAK